MCITYWTGILLIIISKPAIPSEDNTDEEIERQALVCVFVCVCVCVCLHVWDPAYVLWLQLHPVVIVIRYALGCVCFVCVCVCVCVCDTL